MLRLLPAFDAGQFLAPVLVVASSDANSKDRARIALPVRTRSVVFGWRCFSSLALQNSVLREIPRSRSVKQSYFTSIFTTLWALLFSVWMVLQEKPDVVRVPP
jgi:beta-1,4-N-acetylglucosaminyltransferase